MGFGRIISPPCLVLIWTKGNGSLQLAIYLDHQDIERTLQGDDFLDGAKDYLDNQSVFPPPLPVHMHQTLHLFGWAFVHFLP